MVRRAFPRYVRAAQHELPARYIIARSTPADFLQSTPTNELWREHDRRMGDALETQGLLDAGLRKADSLKQQERSLLHLKYLLGSRMLESCNLCERACRKNRTKGEMGYCRLGDRMSLSSCFVHMGEEPEVVPSFTVYDLGWPN